MCFILLVLIVDVICEMLLYHRMHPSRISNTFAQLFQTNMSEKALNCGIRGLILRASCSFTYCKSEIEH